MSTVEDHELISQDTSGLLQLADFKGKPVCIHNFVGDAQKTWAFTAYATGPSCYRGETIVGKPIDLVYWYLHEVTVTREDGSTMRAVRTVLVDDKGHFFGFVSDGVYQSLRLMIAAIGSGPYDPPQRVMVTQGKGKGSRRFYGLEPAPAETKKGKV